MRLLRLDLFMFSGPDNDLERIFLDAKSSTIPNKIPKQILFTNLFFSRYYEFYIENR